MSTATIRGFGELNLEVPVFENRKASLGLTNLKVESEQFPGEDARFYYGVTPEYQEVGYGPSVTTILGVLSTDFTDWAVKQAIAAIYKEAPRSLKAAQEVGMKAYRATVDFHSDVGKKLHDIAPLPNAQAFEKAMDLDFSASAETAKMVQTAISSWVEFKNELGDFEWLAKEEKVLYRGPFGWYGGTYDALWKLDDGRQVMVDFKTSRYLYPKYYYQIAAYRRAFLLGHGGGPADIERRVHAAWLLRLNKYWQAHELKEAPISDIHNFDKAHALYNRDRQIMSRII